MRRILLFSIILLPLLIINASAQSSGMKYPESKPRQNVYVELGGNGLAFAGVYESRLKKSSDGVGVKFGLGGYTSDYEKVITVPVSYTHLTLPTKA